MAKVIAGKVLYGVVCLAAAVLMVVSGYAHKVVGLTTELGRGVAISNSPTVGAMNVLVMGLESRTDYQGNTLPNSLLTAMHAGSAAAVAAGQLGSQDTNTLILIHIFAGGQKAVGFSIPRDDLVTYPQTYDGQSEGKIDGAYAYAYTQYLNENTGKEAKADLYLHANQAGQQATIATVESVTGQHIDHFVEVNLAGFYYLAAAFGGIEVCVLPAPASAEPDGMEAGTNLTDADPLTGTDNSGFNAYKDGYQRKKGGPQYLHLTAPQALAFVRSRDTLPGIDLGRTKRQQATIDYVIYQLKHEGAFADLGKLNSLLGTASQYLITDSSFNLLDFATDMRALNGQDLSFTTLPFTPQNNVYVPGYPGLQDVNIIDVPAIQQLVATAFKSSPGEPTASPSPSATASASGSGSGSRTASGAASAPGTASASGTASATPTATATVDVYNGNPAAGGLAGQVSTALAAQGYRAGAVKDSSAQSQPVQTGTQVFYGTGAEDAAQRIAVQFGTAPTALSTVAAGHVEVLLGSTVTQVPAGIAPAASASPGTGTAGISAATAGTQATGARLLSGQAAASPSATPSPSATSSLGSSGTGGTVTVSPNAPYGIPCVY